MLVCVCACVYMCTHKAQMQDQWHKTRLFINARQAQTQKGLPAEKTEDGGSLQIKR